MIANETILKQIELQLLHAKQAGNEAKLRESLNAIRVLCDVVLDEQTSSQAAVVSTQPVLQQAFPVGSQSRNEEDDANGASLFDF